MGGSWAERLVADCRAGLSAVLPLEREFLDRLLDHGEVISVLITQDPVLAERVATHAGLASKALNVRKHKGAKTR